MEFFPISKTIKLRSHNGKYLIAADDRKTVLQSENSSSWRSRWVVELVDDNPNQIRLKSCHGCYVAASTSAFLWGMTGKKVVQAEVGAANYVSMGWEPVKDGVQVKLKAFGGTFLRANGGPPPWKDSVTHDNPRIDSTKNWICWSVEVLDVLEDEDETAMDIFLNARAVRLQSKYGKFLTAGEKEVSVYQDRDGSSNSARWTVEFVDGADNVIRLKSCYNNYLTASNLPFLLKTTGLKVLQTLPAGRLDSSVEWEPIREGNRVKFRTRHGNLLRANGGVPPWRNSVTHHAHNDETSTKDRLLWDVDVVEIATPRMELPIRTEPIGDLTESNSPSTIQWSNLRRQESSDSLDDSPTAAVSEGRKIYYQVADEYGNVEEGCEVPFIIFKGNEVTELTRVLEDETGLENIVLCTISALDDKLYPLRLHLPPNSVAMNVIVLESSSQALKDMTRTSVTFSRET